MFRQGGARIGLTTDEALAQEARMAFFGVTRYERYPGLTEWEIRLPELVDG